MDGLIALIVIIAIVNAIVATSKREKAERQARQEPIPQAPRAQADIPHTEEGRADYLREVKPGASAAPAKPATPAKPVPQVKPAPGAEGTTSTQGERPEEHAVHRRRIAEEEEALRLERETLRDLRAANTEKLRAAVVMSEVLGRPVALRARTGCRR